MPNARDFLAHIYLSISQPNRLTGADIAAAYPYRIYKNRIWAIYYKSLT